MPEINWSILKREREQRQVQLFKESFDLISEAKIELIENDPPDFSLFVNGKKISLEITELVWDEDKDGINKKAQEGKADVIMYLARLEYEKLNLPPLQVNVSFKDRYGLLKDKNSLELDSSDKKNLSKYIVDKVVANLPDDDQFIIRIDDYNEKWERILDKKIENICISRFPELTENCWAADGGGAIPPITYEKINERINKKNKSLFVYKALYDASWLLLVEDWGGVSGYFDFNSASETINDSYKTDFDRVFILRSKRGQVIELKLLNSEQNV